MKSFYKVASTSALGVLLSVSAPLSAIALDTEQNTNSITSSHVGGVGPMNGVTPNTRQNGTNFEIPNVLPDFVPFEDTEPVEPPEEPGEPEPPIDPPVEPPIEPEPPIDPPVEPPADPPIVPPVDPEPPIIPPIEPPNEPRNPETPSKNPQTPGTPPPNSSYDPNRTAENNTQRNNASTYGNSGTTGNASDSSGYKHSVTVGSKELANTGTNLIALTAGLGSMFLGGVAIKAGKEKYRLKHKKY